MVKYISPIPLILFLISSLFSQDHPNLTLTASGVAKIKKELLNVPLFQKTIDNAKKQVDLEIELGVMVPMPKDMAGGYTHERHKRNFFILQMAGNLYQITGDEKYAAYIKESLMAYTKMYPTLPLHPTNNSYATGKIFWQCLNDANWLVYVSQAYDCIYNYLSKKERKYLERDLFRPFAKFLSEDNPKFFNRIHNHSTWANAAVGMIGLVMDDKELIERALYGLENDGIDENAVDNDGGYIKVKGVRKAGFLAQLDHSFAPDGYFTEGPYYLRYAIFPFLVYAKSLANHKPELDIFNYRDGILEKAVNSLLLQTNANGEFFPINDAQKGMSWKARELITAVNMMYAYKGQNPELLSIAKKQNNVLLDETGFDIAKAITEGKEKEYQPHSIIFGDGEHGDEGGVAVVRNGDACIVMKYSAQGMGHGHFDKLSYSLYDGIGEVIQDYGAVRWVNIDQKGGGRYLPENQTFGKQSIGHNTLVVNETSHYEASVKKGEAHHPELYFEDISNPATQVISAKDYHAYEQVVMHRTLVMIDDEKFNNPLILDLMRAESPDTNQYDLPLWYMGHTLSMNFEIKKELDSLVPLGEKYGYQHIWDQGSGKSDEDHIKLSWFGNGKFYTMTSTVEKNDELIFGRLGANDPNFNLRPDPVFIHRKPQATNATYVSIIESHGTYDPISEIPMNPFSEISSLKLLHDSKDYTVIHFENKEKTAWTFAISNLNIDNQNQHTLNIDGKKIQWSGAYTLIKNKI